MHILLEPAWKTPIMNVPGGLEYLNVSQSNREMEFEKWMNYLINISCAVYQIDPAEVNFPNNGGVGGKGSSFMEGGNREKMKNSKDKGLKPLLNFIASLINKYIIHQFSSDFMFCFKGLEENSEKDQADLDAVKVKTYKTVNEIRAEHDEDPLPEGDVILDGVYIQYISTMQQQQQQRQTMVMQQIQQAQQNQMMMNDATQQEPVQDTKTTEDVSKDTESKDNSETDTKKSLEIEIDV